MIDNIIIWATSFLISTMLLLFAGIFLKFIYTLCENMGIIYSIGLISLTLLLTIGLHRAFKDEKK